jgi:hypothetical protein
MFLCFGERLSSISESFNATEAGTAVSEAKRREPDAVGRVASFATIRASEALTTYRRPFAVRFRQSTKEEPTE